MPDLSPIPGAAIVERVEENCLKVGLTEEYRALEEIVVSTQVLGWSYFGGVESLLFAQGLLRRARS